MEIILERYLVKETGLIASKRLLVVQNESGLFEVVKHIDYGRGAGVAVAKMPIKPYKTRKGAERAMQKWQPKRYQMTLAEGLMLQGKI
ncbi:hypothetical protein [Pectobacterium phage PcCB7V]|nr:hypothetical protein [Pectobacterium phage PcCB7V]